MEGKIMASKDFSKLIRNIEQLTAANHLTGALMAIAGYYGLKSCLEILKRIGEISVIEGEMPTLLGGYRHEIYQRIMDTLKTNHPDEYPAVYNAL
jgi:hypothetical protein